MLPDSDNYLAEMLVKNVGAYTRGTGSTAAGTAAARSILSGKGLLHPGDRLVDGSGLARENRLSAASLTGSPRRRGLRAVVGLDADRVARPGRRGHAQAPLPRCAVRRRVHAKTGYISGTSTLAGIVESRSGSRYAFAIMMNQGSITGAKATQDRIVTLLASGVADGA